MVRRISPSQFRSMVRQAEQKHRQAVSGYNRAVRKTNQAINEYNRKVTKAINDYNREVRTHNARVRANRQRLKNELARLNRQPNTVMHLATFRTSVNAVQRAYERLERSAETGGLDERYTEVLDLSEREAANNLGLMNALLGDVRTRDSVAPAAHESPLTPILTAISEDLGKRWQGALHALSPHNPDAARHFCTNAREVIARILNAKAPDDAVIAAMPDCERTPQQGTPTRRAKIRYFLHMKGMDNGELEAFVESDMNNVVELFNVFNEGTHGAAGTFDLPQLQAIRQRVEDGIMFLSRLIE